MDCMFHISARMLLLFIVAYGGTGIIHPSVCLEKLETQDPRLQTLLT
jgi:hypothetical protein